jgi:hypothetical protein
VRLDNEGTEARAWLQVVARRVIILGEVCAGASWDLLQALRPAIGSATRNLVLCPPRTCRVAWHQGRRRARDRPRGAHLDGQRRVAQFISVDGLRQPQAQFITSTLYPPPLVRDDEGGAPDGHATVRVNSVRSLTQRLYSNTHGSNVVKSLQISSTSVLRIAL